MKTISLKPSVPLIKLLFILGLFLASLILARTVFAQTNSEEIAQKYNVTFPITELGGCTDYTSCHTFCEDPINQNICIDYAKSKGFYKEGALDDNELINKAKARLGCDSLASCQNFCEVSANYEKCHSFAQNQNVAGGYVNNPEQGQILSRAKEVLGCDTASGCKSFCDNPENAPKCSQFAGEVGLKGGEHQVGPGGCTSQSSCQAFCSDPNNFQVCSGFQSVSGSTFSGPGGCTSEESCRSYCQQNKSQCKSFFGGSGGSPPPPGYNLQEMCNRTPNCAWQGDTCQCGFYGETAETREKAQEYAGFCAANPDKCKPGEAGNLGNSQQIQEFEDFCKNNPDRCRTPTTGTYYPGYTGGTDPSIECTKYGCTWTGNSCQCSGISGSTGNTDSTYAPSPYYNQPSYTPSSDYNYDYSQPSYTEPSGGSYTSPSYSYTPAPSYTPPQDYSQPSSSQTYTEPQPAPSYSEPAPAPSTTQESAPPPPTTETSTQPVQGATTEMNFLQLILNFIFNR